jgi:hypothetical protein
VPRTVTDKEIPALLQKWNFFERDKHWTGEFPNDFVEEKLTVLDRTTGLLWTKAVYNDFRDYIEVRLRVRSLNRQRSAGYNDWRLPTLEEAASLLSCERREGDRLYLHPLFPALPRDLDCDGPASTLLTADYTYYTKNSLSLTSLWGVNFWAAKFIGSCSCDFDLHHGYHIRLCRTHASARS